MRDQGVSHGIAFVPQNKGTSKTMLAFCCRLVSSISLSSVNHIIDWMIQGLGEKTMHISLYLGTSYLEDIDGHSCCKADLWPDYTEYLVSNRLAIKQQMLFIPYVPSASSFCTPCKRWMFVVVVAEKKTPYSLIGT